MGIRGFQIRDLRKKSVCYGKEHKFDLIYILVKMHLYLVPCDYIMSSVCLCFFHCVILVSKARFLISQICCIYSFIQQAFTEHIIIAYGTF